ncbi:MAG TPA: DUF6461 domain-containing protein [Jatrophihabitans sp.]|jgi:hypothetical protein|nr:DUF6461 domain-containing protein [Jatrophihabitans sp.]
MTVADYAWVDDLPELTLALIEFAGGPEDLFAEVSRSARDLRPDEDMWQLGADDLEPMLVGRLGPWLTLLAYNGFLLSLPEVAADASRVGRVVSIYQSVNADMAFVLAEHGDVLRRFDPLLDGPGEGDGEPLPEEAGLPFGRDDQAVWPAAFALLERVTGQRITLAWLTDDDRPCVVVDRTA